MLKIILLYSSLALGLLLGFFKDTNKQHAKQRIKPDLARRWLRCAICGNYQNIAGDYCMNHDLPTFMLYVSQRQQKRIEHHISYLWTYPTIKRHQDRFIAFVMRLEDLTDDEWTTEAAITVYEDVWPHRLQKFADFMLALEEATGARLDVDDVVTQFLVAERMEDDEVKVTQN